MALRSVKVSWRGRLLLFVTAKVTASIANGTYVRLGVEAARFRLEEREYWMQPSPAASEASSAVRPAPEPFGRGLFWHAADDWVLMVAEPVASYDPSTLVPPIVIALARASSTPWTVSEPT